MLYGEMSEDDLATRMIHDGRSVELHNITELKINKDIRDRMVEFLISNLYKGYEKCRK